MARILVTEEIADGGLDRLRAAGHEVDVRHGLSPAELLDAVAGAHALIIRSATTVTDEVLAAGSDLLVVGRAGIGLDNVDVEAATPPRRDGRQRPAEQHRLGRRAHDGAAARPGPQRPPGPRRARRRALGAQPVGGRRARRQDARHRRPRAHRQARRRPRPRLRHAPHRLRPVRVGRARPPARRRAAAARPGRRRVRLPDDPPAEDGRDEGADRARRCCSRRSRRCA